MWLAALGLPLACYYATFYAPEPSEASLFVRGVFYLAALTLFYLGAALIYTIFIYPFWMVGKKVGLLKYLWAVIITVLLFIALGIDAHVFYMFRYHVTPGVFDLMYNMNGQIIDITGETRKSIAYETAFVVVYSVAAVIGAVILSRKGFKARRVAKWVVLGYILANLVNAWGAATGKQSIMEIASRVPMYFPVSINHTLIRWGLLSEDMLRNRSADVNTAGVFNYPRKEISYGNMGPKHNVLVLAVDALRFDMLSSDVMPNAWKFAQDNYNFTNYYSGGNSTRGGIFTFFYGIPGQYFAQAKATGVRAAVVSAALDRGYDVATFTSATLAMPEFNETVFANILNLRIESPMGEAWERDNSAVEDFGKYLENRDRDQPFFAFIFLDNVHGISMPADSPHPFKPFQYGVNYLDLTEQKDPIPFLNLYKNTCNYADNNIGRVLQALEDQGLMDDTVVIITADHGQEFNENKLNYWGHGSNFTDWQIKVPLVVHWPGRGSGVNHTLSVCYDVSTTLMQDLFKVKYPSYDYSVGFNLFDLPKDRINFLSGSHMTNAWVEQERIVVIDNYGMLYFKDKTYHDSANRERSSDLGEAIRQLTAYIKVKDFDRGSGADEENASKPVSEPQTVASKEQSEDKAQTESVATDTESVPDTENLQAENTVTESAATDADPSGSENFRDRYVPADVPVPDADPSGTSAVRSDYEPVAPAGTQDAAGL